MDFTHYWQYTDLLTKTLFFVLIAMSIFSWITGILRLINSHKLKQYASQQLHHAVTKQTLLELNPTEKKQATEQLLLQQLARLRYQCEAGLPVLGTTAAIAPFVGLFGTVWGIFHALTAIGQSGQAGLGQVAGPVGEALIMTGLGLAVAIPAVIFYNLALKLNRSVMYQANDTAHQVLVDSLTLKKPVNQSSKK